MRLNYLKQPKRLYLPALLLSTLFLSLSFSLAEKFFTDKTLFLAVPGFLILGGIALYLTKVKKLDTRSFVILLFAAGFLLRLCYILYTGNTVRQHDMNDFYSGYVGHAGYINYFADNWKLPDFPPQSVWQFYHPPLHHFLAAVWMKLHMLLGIDYNSAAESIQFLTLFYSSACMLISYRVFQELKLKGRGLICAFSIVAFNPSFIIFAGSINNDILSTTFIYAALLAGIRWARTKSMSHIIQLAIFIGLGMLSKTSAGIVAPCMAVVFALVFFKKDADKKALIKQYAVFAAICIPIGLFWAVRNLIVFGDPSLSVPLITFEADQYIGTYSFLDRFVLPIKESFSSEFIIWGPVFENHALSGLLKTSAFGEFILTNFSPAVGTFTPFLLLFNISLAFIGFFGAIKAAISKNLGLYKKILLCGNYFLTLGFYFYFCYSFPHTCSMNIRYVALLIVLTALFVGRLIQDGGPKWLSRFSVAATVHFCIFSAVVYTLLGIPMG